LIITVFFKYLRIAVQFW